MTEADFIIKALQSIHPKSEFIVGDTYESLKWHSKDFSKPTKVEFDNALTKVKSDYDANKFQRDRLTEYPSIQELVVALYDADDKAEIDKKRADIKKKYPKPE